MIAGLDSSFDRPTPTQAAAAYAAGVRVWGGYIGTRGGLGLATLWTQADFDVVKAAGMTAIGFCSGWEDPTAIGNLAASWGLLLCVDVEPGIRDDGSWVQGWLDASGAGLYGLPSVHYNAGGRRAAFHIMATYLGYDPGATWGGWLPRPPAPCGWQWQGGHSEFGLNVDRAWYDDWFGAGGSNVTGNEKLAFVRLAYSAFLWRIPAPAEQSGWAGQIADDGSNLDAIMAGIEDSAEGDAVKALRVKLLAGGAVGPAGPAGPAGPPGPAPQLPAPPPAGFLASLQALVDWLKKLGWS